MKYPVRRRSEDRRTRVALKSLVLTAQFDTVFGYN
jgi:hypothetical protein